MIKISNQKKIAGLLIVVLTVWAAFSVIPSSASGQVVSAQSKASEILSNVVGLNMSSYAEKVTSENVSATSINGGLQDKITLSLESPTSSLRSTCTFTNGNLSMLYLDDYSGLPSLSQAATTIPASAQGFLQRYQNYVGNSLYGSFASTLANVSPNHNVTKTDGNIKLQVSVMANQTEQGLVWTYVDSNGVPAPMKDVVLTYSHGHLESFLDNWGLYQIAAVPTLSRQDAIGIALQAVKNFSYTAQKADGSNFTVSGFHVAAVFDTELSYLNYVQNTPDESIRSSSYLLYPSWYIGVGFSQMYPGNVTGLNVRVWADTGNVSSTEPIIVDVVPSASCLVQTTTSTQPLVSQLSIAPIALSSVAATFGGVMAIYLFSNGKRQLFRQTPKIRALRQKLAAICLVIIATTSLVLLVPSTHALYTAKSENFDSNSGFCQFNNTQFVQLEEPTCRNIVNNITYDYTHNANTANAGTFFSANEYGAAQTIIDDTFYDEQNYHSTYTFAIGNGPVNYDMSDSPPTYLTASNLQSSTSGLPGSSFAWMYICQSAGVSPSSLDYSWAQAWTQTSASFFSQYSNGFSSPAPDGPCFIGFAGQSPMLSEDSFSTSSVPMWQFVDAFYGYATTGYTVYSSLEQTSEAVFKVPYWQSPLIGYTAWWPGGYLMNGTYESSGFHASFEAGKMEVFGNSLLYISPNPNNSETVSTPTFPSCSTVGDTCTLSIHSTDSGNSNVNYLINWGDGGWTLYTNSENGYPSGTSQFSHTYSSNGQYTVTVYAESADGIWSQPSTYQVSFAGDVTLYVSAKDNYFGAAMYPNVYVDYNPNNPIPVGTAPLAIQVSQGYHAVGVTGALQYGPYQFTISMIYDQTNGNWYYDGSSIPITTQTVLIAIYTP